MGRWGVGGELVANGPRKKLKLYFLGWKVELHGRWDAFPGRRVSRKS
jgi:hypothetical protein